MSDLRPMVKVGQIYASNRKADIADGLLQCRAVCRVEGSFAWLQSQPEYAVGRGPTVQIRIRDDITSQSIPGYRLVKDVS